jgi:hypothetical protein
MKPMSSDEIVAAQIEHHPTAMHFRCHVGLGVPRGIADDLERKQFVQRIAVFLTKFRKVVRNASIAVERHIPAPSCL